MTPEASAATCHCGRPATITEFAPNMDDYCDPCTSARCDIISAVDCPHFRAESSAVPERICSQCGVFITAHGRRCPVTVWCPHCAAEPGDRCVKPSGFPMQVGSHARRVKAASADG